MIPRLALFILLGLLTGCSKPAQKELRVGMELSYPPFEMTDEQGHPVGVSVDLAEALGAELGRPVQIQNIPFQGLIPSLRTGKIDLIISSLTATNERRESIDFSEPYLTTGLALLVPAASPVQSIADLAGAGHTIAVKEGTTGYYYAKAHLPDAHTLVLDQESACVLEVAQGKAEAFLYDQLSTLQNAQQNPKTTRALLQPITSEPWAIGLRKDNDALREQVNQFLLHFRSGGGFQKLGDKWLHEQKATFVQQGIPFVF